MDLNSTLNITTIMNPIKEYVTVNNCLDYNIFLIDENLKVKYILLLSICLLIIIFYKMIYFKLELIKLNNNKKRD